MTETLESLENKVKLRGQKRSISELIAETYRAFQEGHQKRVRENKQLQDDIEDLEELLSCMRKVSSVQ